MQDLIQQILETTKNQDRSLKPRQRFYREFDLALHLASRSEDSTTFSSQLERIETLGREAGLPLTEIAARKKTLLWAKSQTH